MALMYRVRAVWTGVAGSPAYSNFYAVAPTGGPTTFQNEVAQFIDGLCDYICTPVAINVEGEVPLIDSVTGEIQSIASVTPSNIAGRATGEMVPRASQLLVRWRTEAFIGGRRLQGRTFIPYVDQVANDDGRVDPTVVANLANVITPFIVAMDGKLVVWSKTSGGTAPITSGGLWDQWAQMRSRRD